MLDPPGAIEVPTGAPKQHRNTKQHRNMRLASIRTWSSGKGEWAVRWVLGGPYNVVVMFCLLLISTASTMASPHEVIVILPKRTNCGQPALLIPGGCWITIRARMWGRGTLFAEEEEDHFDVGRQTKFKVSRGWWPFCRGGQYLELGKYNQFLYRSIFELDRGKSPRHMCFFSSSAPCLHPRPHLSFYHVLGVQN